MSRNSALAFALFIGAAVGCANDAASRLTSPASAATARGGNDRGYDDRRYDDRGYHDRGHDVLAALAQVRRVTAPYHLIDAAMADGYTAWSPNPFAAGATCPSSPSGQGKMGYHLVNVSLRGGAAHPENGDATIDPMRPEMLLYEKRADGQMHLVGVEYIVFKAAWERAHGAGAAPPTVFGQPLLASAHTFPGTLNPAEMVPHYELHVWLWSSNPLGMFYPWNPTVSC